jgi:hypothetical protein
MFHTPSRRPASRLLLAALLGAAALAAAAPVGAQVQAFRRPAERRTDLLGVLVQPRVLQAGQPARLVLRLNRPAPRDGIQVLLSSSDRKALRLPKKLTIPYGTVSLDLTVTPRAVKKDQAVTVTAARIDRRQKSGRGIERKAKITVQPESN